MRSLHISRAQLAPYQARTPGALREQILFRLPVPPRSLNPDVSVELEAVCLRCLSKLPADRFSTAAELAHLYPKLSPGGVLLVDDYGQWKGQREAVDAYLAKHRIPMLLSRIDAAARMGIKPAH